MYVQKVVLFKADACDVSRLIEEEFGFEEFNVPYAIMEGDNTLEVSISSEKIDQKLIDEFKENGYNVTDLFFTFECLLCDLCHQGKLEAGDYLFEFDD